MSSSHPEEASHWDEEKGKEGENDSEIDIEGKDEEADEDTGFVLDKSLMPSVPLGELFDGAKEDDLLSLQQLGVESFDTCVFKSNITLR